jgi:hypothetical protein
MVPRARGDNPENGLERCSDCLTSLGSPIVDGQYFQLIQPGWRHQSDCLALMGLGQRARQVRSN